MRPIVNVKNCREAATAKRRSPSRRLRVLMSAHEFSPARGSECAVGWNIVTRMAAFHDVTVLCADGPALSENAYRGEVLEYFARHGALPGLRVVFVEQPGEAVRYAELNRTLMTLTGGIGWQPLYYLGLDAWHQAALGRAQELGLENFDIVHQLTPISFRKPGYLWTTGLPFFWGPIGGMFKVPWAFTRTGGARSILFETARSANIGWQTRFSHNFKQAAQNASRIWTVTKEESRIVDAVTKTHKTSLMIDTAPPVHIRGYVRRYVRTRPLRVCWSGRHEAIKALPLVLRAVASLAERDKIELDILGDGPATNRWKRLAKTLRLSNLSWHGRLPYQKALQTMGQADVMVHSGIREAASMVVLEAMGWGLPVICHDACGMAAAVDDSCGIKIPFMNPLQSIKGFRDALEGLLRNPEKVERLSAGALRRASVLSWEAKVKEIARSYSDCAQQISE